MSVVAGAEPTRLAVHEPSYRQDPPEGGVGRVSVLGIDPGPIMSAYALIRMDTCRVEAADKIGNEELRSLLVSGGLRADVCAVEKVASYGMAVGAEVFDTCIWTGVFAECVRSWQQVETVLVTRSRVKHHHCHATVARDSNVIQALVDRFAYGCPNRGKGTKQNPGWFYGVKQDMWQAYALAVYVADQATGRQPV